MGASVSTSTSGARSAGNLSAFAPLLEAVAPCHRSRNVTERLDALGLPVLAAYTTTYVQRAKTSPAAAAATATAADAAAVFWVTTESVESNEHAATKLLSTLLREARSKADVARASAAVSVSSSSSRDHLTPQTAAGSSRLICFPQIITFREDVHAERALVERLDDPPFESLHEDTSSQVISACANTLGMQWSTGYNAWPTHFVASMIDPRLIVKYHSEIRNCFPTKSAEAPSLLDWDIFGDLVLKNLIPLGDTSATVVLKLDVPGWAKFKRVMGWLEATPQGQQFITASSWLCCSKHSMPQLLDTLASPTRSLPFCGVLGSAYGDPCHACLNAEGTPQRVRDTLCCERRTACSRCEKLYFCLDHRPTPARDRANSTYASVPIAHAKQKQLWQAAGNLCAHCVGVLAPYIRKLPVKVATGPGDIGERNCAGAGAGAGAGAPADAATRTRSPPSKRQLGVGPRSSDTDVDDATHGPADASSSARGPLTS